MRKIIRKVFCLLAAIVLSVVTFSPMHADAATALDEGAIAILSNLEPQLIVESYEVVEGRMVQGENFTMKINVKNTNEYADAVNVMITYSSETDNIRLADYETNQHYEPIIKAGQSLSYEIDMQVMDTYEEDTVVMNFMFAYAGRNGSGYENTSMITPKIGQSCEMKINSLTVSQTAMVGAKSLVNLRYSSVGKRPIKSAIMVIKGDISENEKEIPLEGVSGSEQKYLDYYVNFLNPGKQTLYISFEYTDDEGREYTLDAQEFQVEVSSYQSEVTVMSASDANTDVATENEKYLVVGCVGIIVAVLIFITINVIKRKEEK